MRRIFLIDCPGVVYPSEDSESDIVLKGVVSLRPLPTYFCSFPTKVFLMRCFWWLECFEQRFGCESLLLIPKCFCLILCLKAKLSNACRFMSLIGLIFVHFPHKGPSGEDQEPRGAHWCSAGACQARIHSEDLPHPYLELGWRFSWEAGISLWETFEGLNIPLLLCCWTSLPQVLFDLFIHLMTSSQCFYQIICHD